MSDTKDSQDYLIEFPAAWARKFRASQDPGKTYWLSFKKDRINEGYESHDELQTPDP